MDTTCCVNANRLQAMEISWRINASSIRSPLRQQLVVTAQLWLMRPLEPHGHQAGQVFCANLFSTAAASQHLLHSIQGNIEIILASQFLYLVHHLARLGFVHLVQIVPERAQDVLTHLAVVPCTRLPGQIKTTGLF